MQALWRVFGWERSTQVQTTVVYQNWVDHDMLALRGPFGASLGLDQSALEYLC